MHQFLEHINQDIKRRLSIRPLPSHHQISLLVGTVIESEVRSTGVQLKRKAKLPTVIGLTTKNAVLQYIKVIANPFILGNYFNGLR